MKNRPVADPLKGLEPEALALKAKAGSLVAFERIIEIFQDRLYNFLLRIVRRPQDAEEIAQEAFVKAWTHIQSYNPNYRFSTWLYTIATRVAITKRRRDALVPGAMDSVRQELGSRAVKTVVEEISDMEQSELVWQIAEERLPPDQLAAMWLRYVDDYQNSEIAPILHKSEVGVRVTLFRARRTIYDAMQEPCRPRQSADGSTAMSRIAATLAGLLGRKDEGVAGVRG
jgi:RNA polymerase sigma-70 factor, ECF subfamily